MMCRFQITNCTVSVTGHRQSGDQSTISIIYLAEVTKRYDMHIILAIPLSA